MIVQQFDLCRALPGCAVVALAAGREGAWFAPRGSSEAQIIRHHCSGRQISPQHTMSHSHRKINVQVPCFSVQHVSVWATPLSRSFFFFGQLLFFHAVTSRYSTVKNRYYLRIVQTSWFLKNIWSFASAGFLNRRQNVIHGGFLPLSFPISLDTVEMTWAMLSVANSDASSSTYLHASHFFFLLIFLSFLLLCFLTFLPSHNSNSQDALKSTIWINLDDCSVISSTVVRFLCVFRVILISLPILCRHNILSSSSSALRRPIHPPALCSRLSLCIPVAPSFLRLSCVVLVSLLLSFLIRSSHLFIFWI